MHLRLACTWINQYKEWPEERRSAPDLNCQIRKDSWWCHLGLRGQRSERPKRLFYGISWSYDTRHILFGVGQNGSFIKKKKKHLTTFWNLCSNWSLWYHVGIISLKNIFIIILVKASVGNWGFIFELKPQLPTEALVKFF